MRRTQSLPELLSPAGSPSAAYAAIKAGADALYLGLNEGASNARVHAENFSREALTALIPYAHANGVKIYLTLNTLAYRDELDGLLSLAHFAREAGTDAFIVADLGLAALLSEQIPDVPLHASTQAFVHAKRSADALWRLGFSRVVLSRECDRESLADITAHARPETEVFVHGALCVSHSGQCLFSSLVGGRSGNRGACAQPCRLPYENGKYPLSLKDLSLAAHIPELIEDGIASLKIEGRMKSPEYVYTVTSVFRRLLDEGRGANADEWQMLKDAFSRSGFTDGYYTRKTQSGMIGIRREQDKEASRTLCERSFPPEPITVTGEAFLQKGMPSRLSLTLKERPSLSVSAEGMIPQAAENAALTEDAVRARLSKLGGEGMRLDALSLTLEDGLFLPVGAQNALRREAAQKLLTALAAEKEQNTVFPEKEAESAPSPLGKAPHTAVFYRAKTYLETDTSLFDAAFLPLDEILLCRAKMPNGVVVPPVLMDRECDTVLAKLEELGAMGVRYALVASLGGAALAREADLIPIGDFRLNILNLSAAARYAACGIGYSVLSPELPTAQARRFENCGYIVYGRIPLMLTERCFVRDVHGCSACSNAVLTDRRGAKFPMMREYGHRTLIFNSLPTYLGDTEELQNHLSKIGKHFIFSTESAREANEIIACYLSHRKLPYAVRRAYK